MATTAMSTVIQQLRRIVLGREPADLTDGQLLHCFISERDEDAFGALVRRHGPMVMGVCRRVLGNCHDAEDAFQATFLVLVRKAGSIASRELLGNWLYGVAYNTALKARATSIKRRAREREVIDVPEPDTVQPDHRQDWLPLLDQELNRLPDKYRVPIVLCDLQGKTRKEAAAQLDVPEGTVAGRLARARTMLADRLGRHGVVLSAGALGMLLSQNLASASVSTTVVSSTIQAATLFAAGQSAASALSANVVALTEGVLKAMLLSKLKIAVAVFVALGIMLGGASLVSQHLKTEAAAADKVKVPASGEQVEGSLHGLNTSKNTITVRITSKANGQKTEEDKTFDVTADTRIVVSTGVKENKAVKLAELVEGMRIIVHLSADKKAAVSIQASVKTNGLEAGLKAVDVSKNTITISTKDKDSKQQIEKSFDVATDATITLVNHGKEGSKAGKLGDLKEGMKVSLRLSADNKVLAISVPAPVAEGVLKTVDAAKNSIAITVGAKDKAAVFTYEVDKKAPITIEGKESKLTDLKEGMVLNLQLSREDSGVVGIRVGEKTKVVK